MEPAAPGDPGCFDIRLDRDTQGLRFEDNGRAAESSQYADQYRQHEEVQFEKRAQHYEQRQAGKGYHQVRQPHDQRIRNATVVGGDRAYCGGDGDRDDRGDDAQDELR